MRSSANKLYKFGPFQVDGEERLLLRNGERIPLTPKAFDTLLILVEKNGHTVEKEELMRLIWPDVAVEENNLSQNIHAIRKALGETTQGTQYIETLPRRGYRFLGVIETSPASESEAILPTEPPPLQTVPAIPSQSVKKQSRSIWIVAGLSACIVLIGGLFFWRRATESVQRHAPELKLTRMTTTSNSWDVAISPDGKTLAYVQGDGLQSVKLKPVSGESESELIAPMEARYRGITFSPDGNSIFFTRKEKGAMAFVLYQRNLHSPEQKIILPQVDSAITFSPDGNKIAFVREDQTTGKSSLIVANIDGSNEKLLATHQTPDHFSVDGPSWSPDGKTIALSVGLTKPVFHFRIATIQVSNGQESFQGEAKWAWAMDVAWLANGKEIILIGRHHNEGTNNNQVWRVNVASGQAQKITNDLNDYRGLSLASNSQKLVTVQVETRANIWIQDQAGNQPIVTTVDAASQNGYDGLDWTPGGQIVYTSLRNGQQDLWRIDPKTQINERLTSDVNDKAVSPSVSNDGRFIVFNSGRVGIPRIWRIDIDGKNPHSLTNSNIDLQPFCSWQQNWAVYSSDKDGRRSIYKIPLDGAPATPQMLIDKFAEAPAVSPDGNFIACNYQADNNSPPQIAIIPAQGGAPTQFVSIPIFARVNVRWHPLEKSLSYLSRSDDQTNLWLQSLAGGAPKKITNFSGERIFAYAWSRDGKRLAFSRGTINRDVVMINGLE